tara:strand:+ start:638 stop:1537 length:900 start_codon:yes stop_codon:yes gene_type:complete
MVKKKKAEVFEFKGETYAILTPTSKINEDASMEYNRVFSKSLRNGALLRESLDTFMREQGLWDDEKEAEYTSLLMEISDKEKLLKLGGIKLSEAKELAINIKACRNLVKAMIENRNALDVNSAQGQAENARFNFLLINCLVYNDRTDDNGNFERVYKTMDDFSSEDSDEDSVAVLAAGKFAEFYFGLEKDYESNLIENKFLSEHKFADKDFLLDEQGRKVDYQGRLIDDNFRYINEQGEYVDINGERIDESGEPISDRVKPFLDEKGNPIGATDEDKEEKEPVKKRRGRPKKDKQSSES